MADTASLITEWEATGNAAHKVAAGIARKIDGRKRYDDPPPNSALSAEYHVSERTVTSAKTILREHGILILENRRYYVALPRSPPDTRKTEEAPHARITATASTPGPRRAARASNDAHTALLASHPQILLPAHTRNGTIRGSLDRRERRSRHRGRATGKSA